MAEHEIHGTIEVGTPVWSPVQAKLVGGMSRRWTSRAREAFEVVVDELGEVRLGDLLEESEELDALFARALSAAAESSVQAKRRLLGRAVLAAATDQARIDDSTQTVLLLSQIDTAHVRCMVVLEAAEDEAVEVGEMKTIAHGAEKPITESVNRAASVLPPTLVAALTSLHLVDGRVNWDEYILVKGMTKQGRRILTELRAEGLSSDQLRTP